MTRNVAVIVCGLLATSAAAHADTVEVSGAQNPQSIDLKIDYGSDGPKRSTVGCGLRDGTSSGVTLHLANDVKTLAVDVSDGQVMLVRDGRAHCNDSPVVAMPEFHKLTAGDYELYVKSTKATAIHVDILNPDLPFAASASTPTIALDGDLATPLQVDLPAGFVGQGGWGDCQKNSMHRFSSVPAAVIQRTGPGLDGVKVQLLEEGSTQTEVGAVQVRDMSRPQLSRGCAAGTNMVDMRRLAPGTYGVYYSVYASMAVTKAHLFITSAKSIYEPFDTVVPATAATTIAARAVPAHFPLVQPWKLSEHVRKAEEQLAALLARVPGGLLVYAAEDVAAMGLKKDEPLLVLGARDPRKLEVVSLTGTYGHLFQDQLALAPSGAAAFPTTVFESQLDFNDVRASSDPVADKAIQARFDAVANKFEACGDKIWKSMVGDLPYDYDLLIIEGTHTTSVKDTANAKIEKVCGGERMKKVTKTYVTELNAARVKRHLANVRALEARLQAAP